MFLWHCLSSKVMRFDLEAELRRELDNSWIIRRGEAREPTWRYRRIAFDADIRKPRRIEDDRIGYVVHFLEVGPVEQIEGVEDELDPERAVSVEADLPSHSQISGEEIRPDERVAPYPERAIVVDCIEVDVESGPDVEREAAARRDDR